VSGIITQLQLTRAQTAVSSLSVPDTNTVISINLPPDSDDINFFVSTPDWYQYTAIGFGTTMTDALMLVMYLSADSKGEAIPPLIPVNKSNTRSQIPGVTVSPRVAT
jgi:hypothetical protein